MIIINTTLIIVALHLFSLSFFLGAEHHACPVGLPGTVRHAFSRKIKTNEFLCEKDSDCPNGKCCGILGGNMCIYLHGKENDNNAKQRFSAVLFKPTSKQFFKTIIKINLYVFLQIK